MRDFSILRRAHEFMGAPFIFVTILAVFSIGALVVMGNTPRTDFATTNAPTLSADEAKAEMLAKFDLPETAEQTKESNESKVEVTSNGDARVQSGSSTNTSISITSRSKTTVSGSTSSHDDQTTTTPENSTSSDTSFKINGNTPQDDDNCDWRESSSGKMRFDCEYEAESGE